MQPGHSSRGRGGRGARRSRQLDQRQRRDERRLQQELMQRAEREAVPRNDEAPLPRID